MHFDQPHPPAGHMASYGMALEPSSSSIIYHSPIGPLKLVANGTGISSVKFLFGKHGVSPTVAGGDVEEVGSDSRKKAESHLEACSKWMDAYFDGSLLKPDPPPRPKLALAMKSKKTWS